MREISRSWATPCPPLTQERLLEDARRLASTSQWTAGETVTADLCARCGGWYSADTDPSLFGPSCVCTAPTRSDPRPYTVRCTSVEVASAAPTPVLVEQRAPRNRQERRAAKSQRGRR